MSRPDFRPAEMPCCESCVLMRSETPTEYDPGSSYCGLVGPYELSPVAEAADLCERYPLYVETYELSAQVAAAIARIHDPKRRAATAESFADFMEETLRWFDHDAFTDVARPQKPAEAVGA